MFSIPWSIGAVIDVDGRQKFDQFFRDMIAGKDKTNPIPNSIGKVDILFPEAGLIYDYCFQVGVHIHTSAPIPYEGQ